MYVPKMYRLEQHEAVEMMRSYPFAILITVSEHRPIATHIPVEIREDGGKVYAAGHIAFGNMQKNTLENNPDVLLIFQGPHAYISSSWYQSENVPTWDYLAVHAYGTARIQSTSELESALGDLLRRYESHRPNGRLPETFTPGYLSKEMKGIVGFEIEITSIEASAKMSQNRNEVDYKNIVHELEQSADDTDNRVANWLRKRRSELF